MIGKWSIVFFLSCRTVSTSTTAGNRPGRRFGVANPVTFDGVLNGSGGFQRGRLAMRPRILALVVGAAATLAMGIVGCTKIVDGTSSVDTAAAPAYRASVSQSVSVSAAASSTQAVRGSCGKFTTSSANANMVVNKYVDAVNSNGDVKATEGPAVDALNDAAETVSAAINDAMPSELRDTFSSYSDAARSVADAISTHAPGSVYNSRVEQLNNAHDKGLQQCRSY